ncbi:MAG: hypothetical protein Q9P01_10595 [Anaerolineae bacterium]|nr:hypothetical protein [Anaerolineae bacterium]
MFEAPTLDTLWGYNLSIALPAIWLASSVLIVLLIDLFTGEERKHWTPLAALAAIVIAFVLQMLNFAPEETTAFGGMFAADAFTSISEYRRLRNSVFGDFAQ